MGPCILVALLGVVMAKTARVTEVNPKVYPSLSSALTKWSNLHYHLPLYQVMLMLESLMPVLGMYLLWCGPLNTSHFWWMGLNITGQPLNN
jgi:cytochrome b561